MSSKLTELFHELQTVVVAGRNILDIVVPPFLFLLLSRWLGFQYAVWGALSLAVLFAIWRLVRRQPYLSALGGVAAVLLAMGLVSILDREEGFFLPSILTGIGTVLLAIGSIVAKRPFVACTSYLARRWPWGWYWHPKVRPAYTEVTWFWALYFFIRTALQLNLFQEQQADLLAGLNLIIGWPATLLLLVISYLYGTWRLRKLGGPSVNEYIEKADPPWKSQQSGF